MRKTFREKAIAYFTDVAKRHKYMKYPSIAALLFTLVFYYFGRHFVTNGKRYASMIFVGIFFMSSCSFSFAVFAERTGFTGVQETYSAVVPASDISLAAVKPTAPVALEPEALLTEKESEADYGAVDETQIEAYTLDDILAYHDHEGAHEKEPEETAVTEETTAVETFSFDSSDWRLVLINKQHPIADDYDFKLGTFTSGMRCDERVIEDLLLMMQAAKKEGLNLVVRSPYRTNDHQEDNFNRKIRAYMREGLSYMEAYKVTSQVVTVPGCSEHEVGLALDITSETYLELKQGFADTKEGQWLAEHSHEFGFTLRYPEEKEYITSIVYEPWHFRYVGREAAAVMKKENLCLEEFWDKYL